MKIFITGTSGIGKTTLAKYISARYRIPFIEGSAKRLWEKYGISKHLDIFILPIEKQLEFQHELLDLRESDVNKYEDFVSDRSYVDNIVYFLIQNAPNIDDERVRIYIERAKKLFNETPDSRLIYLNNKDKTNNVVEDDGYRINNVYYQRFVVGSTFDSVIRDNPFGLDINHNNFLLINDWSWETRITLTDNFISRTNVTELKKWVSKHLTKLNLSL